MHTIETLKKYQIVIWCMLRFVQIYSYLTLTFYRSLQQARLFENYGQQYNYLSFVWKRVLRIDVFDFWTRRKVCGLLSHPHICLWTHGVIAQKSIFRGDDVTLYGESARPDRRGNRVNPPGKRFRAARTSQYETKDANVRTALAACAIIFTQRSTT